MGKDERRQLALLVINFREQVKQQNGIGRVVGQATLCSRYVSKQHHCVTLCIAAVLIVGVILGIGNVAYGSTTFHLITQIDGHGKTLDSSPVDDDEGDLYIMGEYLKNVGPANVAYLFGLPAVFLATTRRRIRKPKFYRYEVSVVPD